ncbi:MAG: hypothetical protein Q9N02_09580 [Ghiorsea sp.]|nr:hypothetical protein [Ghiorsea sp.]
MIDADKISISSLPKLVVHLITVCLIACIVVPVFFSIQWLSNMGSSSDLTLALITIVQTMVVLLFAWLYIVYLSPKSTTLIALRKLIDKFLTRELHESLLFVDYDKESHDNINLASNVRVDCTHVNGTPRCDYKLTYIDSKREFHMYVVMNVRKLEVVYYIPPRTDKSIFALTIEGAKQAGYDEKYDYKEQCGDLKFEACTKMVFRRVLKEGFLTDSEESLFIVNDISVMTRSICNEISKQ